MAEERSGKPEWYVAHTYAGYENKVKLDIEQSIKNRNMEELIFEVKIPTQMVTELKKGKEVKREKKSKNVDQKNHNREMQIKVFFLTSGSFLPCRQSYIEPKAKAGKQEKTEDNEK